MPEITPDAAMPYPGYVLDQQTAEHFAQTINRLKGTVTMIFITHQVPKGLQVDEVVNMGQHAMHMSLVKEEM